MPTVPSSHESLFTHMKRRHFLQGIAAASVVPSQALAQSGHDLAVVNARIMTMDPSRPEAEAVLIRNGHILMVGSNSDIERQADGIDRFDARRRVVTPGFIDTHVHFEMT